MKWCYHTCSVGVMVVSLAMLTSGAQADGIPVGPQRMHREVIRGSEARYTVEVGGDLDEFNTLDYQGQRRWRFQPNISVTISNTGDTLVANPRIVINGRRNWHSMGDIIAEIFEPGQNDEERAFALWDWCRRNISGGATTDKTLWGDERSVVRFMNSFGTGACGTFHIVMPLIGDAAGMDCDSGCLGHCAHAVQRERYGGRDHYFDCMIGHGRGQPAGHFPLALDNHTIAGADDICGDRYVLARAGSDAGFGAVLSYFNPGRSFHPMKHQFREPRTMGMALRPGERIERTWLPVERSWVDGKPLPERAPNGRGTVRYQPRLTEKDVRRDAVSLDNMAFGNDGLRAAQTDLSAEVVYRIYSPYVLTGGSLGGTFNVPADGAVELLLSFDGQKWDSIWRGERGQSIAKISLDDRPECGAPALTHHYFLKARIAADAPAATRVVQIWMEAEFQAYLPSLPALAAGENTVEYRDDTAEPHQITIEHRWREATAASIPAAPEALMRPSDGGDSGFNIVFEWKMPDDPGAAIDAYEFFLSPRLDLAWPLLACYHSVIHSPDPKFSPPTTDAFIDGHSYYWRVRARSSDGVWGPWSQTWSFTAHGPGPATDPAVEFDQATGRATLAWQPPGSGRRAVRYQIYASDAPGFTPLLEPTESYLRVGDKEPTVLPANLIGDTTDTQFDVTGRTEPFYRIVAMDDAGSRSQPTVCAALPHPALAAGAPLAAVVGQQFEARIPVIRSIGLPATDCKGPPQYGEDEFSLRINASPDWLTVDGKAGSLRGIPPASARGEHRVTVELAAASGKPCTRDYVIMVR